MKKYYEKVEKLLNEELEFNSIEQLNYKNLKDEVICEIKGLKELIENPDKCIDGLDYIDEQYLYEYIKDTKMEQIEEEYDLTINYYDDIKSEIDYYNSSYILLKRILYYMRSLECNEELILNVLETLESYENEYKEDIVYYEERKTSMLFSLIGLKYIEEEDEKICIIEQNKEIGCTNDKHAYRTVIDDIVDTVVEPDSIKSRLEKHLKTYNERINKFTQLQKYARRIYNKINYIYDEYLEEKIEEN